MAGAKILIVDDEKLVREMIAIFLGSAGYGTMLAQDGTEALSAMEIELPDLVLADVNMPIMNGLKLARRMRSAPAMARIPIMMLSGLAQPREIQSAFTVGVDEYVTKPVELSLLLARTRALLGCVEEDGPSAA